MRFLLVEKSNYVSCIKLIDRKKRFYFSEGSYLELFLDGTFHYFRSERRNVEKICESVCSLFYNYSPEDITVTLDDQNKDKYAEIIKVKDTYEMRSISKELIVERVKKRIPLSENYTKSIVFTPVNKENSENIEKLIIENIITFCQNRL